MKKKILKKISNYFEKFYKTRNEKNIILVERFDYSPSLINFALVSNVLSDIHKAKIISYHPSSLSFIKLLNIKLKNILLKNSTDYLYNKFGVTEFVRPKLKTNNKTNIYFKDKNSIQNFKYKKILIGDLMYDEFLRSNNKITINTNDKNFLKHVEKTIELFEFWYDYLKSKPVKSLVVSHAVYNMGIIIRVAIKFNIPVYYTGPNGLYYFSKLNLNRHSKHIYKNYATFFQKIEKNVKLRILKQSKETLNKRFEGKKDIKLLLDRETINKSFTKKISFSENKKNKNKKTKILIQAHQLNDAVHAYGKSIFPDFYEWLNCLGKLSEKKDFEWFIKTHPSEFKKNLIYFDNLKKKYPKFKILNSSVSNSDLIEKEKIDLVTTVYGSGGHEFPLFGIPVVNASNNGPHIGYNFNFNSKDKLHYINLIKKSDKLKNKKINNKKIYEFYALRFLMEYSPIDNQQFYINKFGKKFMDNYISIFLNQITFKKQFELSSEIKHFVKSKKFRMFYDRTSKKNLYLKNI